MSQGEKEPKDSGWKVLQDVQMGVVPYAVKAIKARVAESVPSLEKRVKFLERKPGAVMSVKSLANVKAVWIPSGGFLMGSPKEEPNRGSDEGPQRWVKISRGFWIWQTEVTQGQFKEVMGYNPAAFGANGKCKNGRRLVEKVSWDEATLFTNKVSKKQGLSVCFECQGEEKKARCKAKSHVGYMGCKGWRLPTEAEWESTYRGGTTTAFYTGECLSTSQGNYYSRYPQRGCPKGMFRAKTLEVGSISPNPLGL